MPEYFLEILPTYELQSEREITLSCIQFLDL